MNLGALTSCIGGGGGITHHGIELGTKVPTKTHGILDVYACAKGDQDRMRHCLFDQRLQMDQDVDNLTYHIVLWSSHCALVTIQCPQL